MATRGSWERPSEQVPYEAAVQTREGMWEALPPGSPWAFTGTVTFSFLQTGWTHRGWGQMSYHLVSPAQGTSSALLLFLFPEEKASALCSIAQGWLRSGCMAH